MLFHSHVIVIIIFSVFFYSTTGVGWRLPILGLSSSYQIIGQNWNGGSAVPVVGPVSPLGVWIHVATSYDSTNGIRLWLNGTLIGSTGSFSYSPSSAPNTVTLGNSLSRQSSCVTGSISKGQFYEKMDELRIYSRELTATEVDALANP
ncbi:unnamed protein product [Rotaria sp. Silwood2]|nr:unnamed protein product [Rotaria sp. Silwood2]CAF4178194.1 unnamed protein product [Rotaria sp. Silwood2]